MRLNSSSFRLVMSCVEAEAPRVIPARGSAGAALNLRVRPLLPGSGVRDVRLVLRTRLPLHGRPPVHDEQSGIVELGCAPKLLGDARDRARV